MTDQHEDSSLKGEELSHHGIEQDIAAETGNATIRLLLERASCRAFDKRPIPPDVMQQILDAGIHAATGGNLQPYSIIKIEDHAAKDRLAELNEGQTFMADAPCNLLFCIDWHRIHRWADLSVAPFTASSSFRHFWISFQDTIIAAQNICTAADALGLGSVYIGTVLECFRELKEMLALPTEVFPVVILTLGYPKVQPKPRRKLPTDIIVHSERYHDPSDQELLAAFEEKYPGWRKELVPAYLRELKRVCREVQGEEFAEHCIAKVKEQGYINAVQNYFGLHYSANVMAARNEEFLAIVKEFGFRWFEKWEPAGPASSE